MRGWTCLCAVALFAGVPAAAQTDVFEPEQKLGSGLASYFNREMRGHRTASGEACDPETLTAAHRTVPFGGRVRVTNLATGVSTIVRINDRGPFRGNRVIDLSYAAARAIGLDRMGTGRVSLALLGN